MVPKKRHTVHEVQLLCFVKNNTAPFLHTRQNTLSTHKGGKYEQGQIAIDAKSAVHSNISRLGSKPQVEDAPREFHRVFREGFSHPVHSRV